MKLSNKSIYGVRALFDLAYHGEGNPLSIREIASREAIPSHFLGQIFQALRRAGLVESRRGPKGGYVLSRPADQITLMMILEALDDAPTFEPPPWLEVDEPEASFDTPSWAAADVAGERLVQALEAFCAGLTLDALMQRGEELGIVRACFERPVYAD